MAIQSGMFHLLSERQALVTLAALTLAAYANAFAGTFQFDDFNVIVLNPQVASLPAWWQSMPGIRPLLKLSYALNQGSGLGLFGFHLFNLAVHLGNGLLVWRLLHLLAQRTGLGDSGARAAWLAAALFLVHPVNTEAVTYISGRSAAFSALFVLAALHVYATRPANRWLSPLLYACAMLTKESALILPLVLLLWDSACTGPAFSLRAALQRQRWHWAVLAVALLALAASPTYRHFLAGNLALRPLAASLPAQPATILYLLGQWLGIGALNADPALPTVSPWTPSAIGAAGCIAAILLAGLHQLRRRPWLGLGLIWFLLQLLPTQTLWPRLDAANDRHLYLPGIGLCWLAGYFLAQRGGWPIRGATALLIAALVVGTLARNTVYSSEIAFWKDVTEKAPHNARAHNNLGYAYAQAGRRDEARAAYRQAVTLDPQSLRARANLLRLEREE